ncbi:glucuronate isomerase [bacterium]|nr:glucuronate isomerase [bacterium]
MTWLNDDFLLSNPTARELYHNFAESRPILDFHSHLSPAEIAADKKWSNLTELWLSGDHYKWRAMRTNGIDERFITGDASDYEKFEKWAETMPAMLRNPLHHWAHLELKRYFGIDEMLSPATARSIWDRCAEKLADPSMSCRGLLKQSNVVLVCTTDDPSDNLQYHQKIAADSSFPIRVCPTFRPDRALAIESTSDYNRYLNKLGEAAGVDIIGYDDLLEALNRRHEYFHKHGCRMSDHGLESVYADETTKPETHRIFARLRTGAALRGMEAIALKSALLREFAEMNHARGWTQQFHLGPIRNNNSRMFRLLGPDAGFDSIGDANFARPLARFLDRLDSENKLARTIFFNLNPRDNAMIAAMIGNFQDGTEPGKIQWGPAWWFLDHKGGIEDQLNTLSAMGLLSRFVGMLTDSRSFTSFVRHEYFRRILCNLLGAEMESGLLPPDMEQVGAMVSDICFDNAARYFKFDLPKSK